jgi:superfamily II DNA/RNA helicase
MTQRWEDVKPALSPLILQIVKQLGTIRVDGTTSSSSDEKKGKKGTSTSSSSSGSSGELVTTGFGFEKMTPVQSACIPVLLNILLLVIIIS